MCHGGQIVGRSGIYLTNNHGTYIYIYIYTDIYAYSYNGNLNPGNSMADLDNMSHPKNHRPRHRSDQCDGQRAMAIEQMKTDKHIINMMVHISNAISKNAIK